MDKNDVQQALLEAAGRAAGLAHGAIEGIGTDAGQAGKSAVEAVERYANAAKALAEAAEVAGRA